MRRLSILVLSVAVLATLFASVQSLISDSLASAAPAPVTTTNNFDLSQNQYIDTSTIRYGGDWYYDSKLDHDYTFVDTNPDAQCKGQSDKTNTITLSQDQILAKQYSSVTLTTYSGSDCTPTDKQVTLLYTDRFLMPFEFVDANTIETSDKQILYKKDASKGLYLEVNSKSGCQDYIKVVQPDNGTFAVLSVTPVFQQNKYINFNSETFSGTPYYNWWHPIDQFATNSATQIDNTHCFKLDAKQFDGATLVMNNPDAQGLETDPNLAGSAGASPSDQLSLDCESGWNPLNWLVCGIIDGFVKAISWVDSLINGMLSIGTDGTGTAPVQIFDNVSDSNSPSYVYYHAWQAFRTIAIGLIIIAGLVIILAQTSGSEIVDAYTVKKTLPRLAIALIGVALSWQLMRFFVGFTNALGYGVRALIYQPFTNGMNGHLNVANIGGGGDAAVSLIAGIAGAALGIFGLLSFVLTAALAVFVAFVVLVLRQLVVLVLVISAPIAIVAYVLPNTKKIYDIWWDSLSKALLMFPIISAIVAIGRVFSYVSNSTADTNSGSVSAGVQHVIGYIAYFAPYFLIPYTLKFAGGALGRLGGMVNDKSKGFFNRLSGYRSKQPAKRWNAAKQGELYKERRWIPGSAAVSSRANRIATGVTMGPALGFGLSQAGKQRRGQIFQTGVDHYAKEHPDLVKTLVAQDDTSAVMALSGGTYAGAKEAKRLLEDQWFTKERAKYNEQVNSGEISAERADGLARAAVARRGDQALASAQALGINHLAAGAALSIMGQNKSRSIDPGRSDLISHGIKQLAHGDGSLERDLAYNFQFLSRQAGRQDLGGNWLGTSPSGGPVEDRSVLFDAVSRGDTRSLVSGHDSTTAFAKDIVTNDVLNGSREQALDSAVLASELYGNFNSATGGNRDNILAMFEQMGIDPTDTRTGTVEEKIAKKINERFKDVQGYEELSASDIRGRSRNFATNSPEAMDRASREAQSANTPAQNQGENPSGRP